MRVLLLTQVLPYPPDSGPKVKTWNLIKYLAREHEITLVSFVRDDPPEAVKRLGHYCSAVHTVPMGRSYLQDGLALVRSLLTGEPWMMLRDDRREMRSLVDQLAAAGRFDIVHADQLNMCQYALRVPGAFRLFDAHNALWVLYRRLAATMSGPKRWLLERDWRLLKEYEGRICRTFDATMAVIEQDAQALQEAAGEPVDIPVIPISVDAQEIGTTDRLPEADRVVHVGTMYWPPNIDGVLWFGRQVWPLIRTRRPDSVFEVIGARPPQEVEALSKYGSGVHVRGYVADLRPHLERTGVFIVPLRAGGGMRVKILNAMARGLPVVSTSLGCEGIQVTDGENILIADTPEAFADAVIRVLDDPELGARLAASGRRLIETVYDYRVALGPMDAIYAGAVSGPGSERLDAVSRGATPQPG